MDKIWVLILSFILIFSFWVSSADLINPVYLPREEKPVTFTNNQPKICREFESVELKSWRVVVLTNVWTIYEEYAYRCINNGVFYILGYDINIEDVNKENINEKADKIVISWNDWDFIDSRNSPKSEQFYVYKIVHNWNWLYETKLIEENGVTLEEKNREEKSIADLDEIEKFKDFVIARFLTVLIETIILFLIAKFCRKSWSIKNRKILVTWILASTVTLPLLWFVLPIFFSNYWVYVIFWEILVTVIEIFIIKYSLKIDRKMAIFASIICNLCSFLFWLFIF